MFVAERCFHYTSTPLSLLCCLALFKVVGHFSNRLWFMSGQANTYTHTHILAPNFSVWSGLTRRPFLTYSLLSTCRLMLGKNDVCCCCCCCWLAVEYAQSVCSQFFVVAWCEAHRNAKTDLFQFFSLLLIIAEKCYCLKYFCLQRSFATLAVQSTMLPLITTNEHRNR